MTEEQLRNITYQEQKNMCFNNIFVCSLKEARNECFRVGGHLLTINDNDELEAVLSGFMKRDIFTVSLYIGLFRKVIFALIDSHTQSLVEMYDLL